ncbi:MAG: ATP-binding protein [Gemmatimonadales bacterium]
MASRSFRSAPERSPQLLGTLGLLMVVPGAYPLLLPTLGPPAHLMWWVHVLPVALVAYWFGRWWAGVTVGASIALVVAGERAFGTGYGQPATWETTVALALALGLTHALVAAFALYARRTTRLYQLLFDHATAAVVRTDTHGVIQAANQQALDLLRTTWPALRGLSLDASPGLAGAPSPATIARAGGWSGTLCLGDAREPITVHVTMVATEDAEAGYQLLLVDRTTEVLQQEELERQGRLATLGETLAGVAHELKNPLQVIDSLAELNLADESLPPSLRDDFAQVRESAGTMRRLVQELLGFSRTGMGDTGTVALDELVDRHVRLQKLTRGKMLQIRYESHWTGQMAASGPKVEQILVNLLSNAADAVSGTAQGAVSVRLDHEGQMAVLTVADNGPGIAPEVRGRLFEAFVTTKAPGKGTGLGLAISRRLATSMGGTLTAANGALGGAVFTLRLPAPRHEAAVA